ncbi:MAG: hypothetical protein ACRDE2_05005 [Chitinophagaceae bacterium]
MKSLYYHLPGIVLFLLSPGILKAQKVDSVKNKPYSIAISASVEFAHLNLSALNESLGQNELPTIKQPVFYLFSFTAMPSSLDQHPFFGISYGSAQSKRDNLDHLTKLKLYIVEANFYYSIWQTSRNLLYPGIGFGLMEYSLLIQNKSKTPSSYNEALNNPGGEIRMQTGDVSLKFSLSYNWALDAEKDYLIGIHAGYRLGLNKPHWKLLTGGELSGAPTTSASGFFAGIDFFIQ